LVSLVDGNKRLALAALIASYGINGRRLTLTNDAAYDLVMKVASGQLDSVDDIAAVLNSHRHPRPTEPGFSSRLKVATGWLARVRGSSVRGASCPT